LPQVAAIGRAHGIPIIVDAAATLPPRSNLKRFIAEGADLVTYSGGKAIKGPQASGVLAGRRDLIASVALQHQDMDVRAETWVKRGLLGERAVAGIPHQGFGRAMKVGREEAVGLIVALQRFAAGSDEADAAIWNEQLNLIESALEGIPNIVVERKQGARQPIPMLDITIDERALGRTAYHVLNDLIEGDPAIAVAESRAEFGVITVNPHSLCDAEFPIVAKRLREVLAT